MKSAAAAAARPTRSPGGGHALAIVGILVITLTAFLPILRNDFVNWDDPDVFQRNAHLGTHGAVSWAFTTSDMGHYQPLSWLAWSAVKALFGLSPRAFHALSLTGHLLNSVLVYLAGSWLAALAGLDLRSRRVTAFTASLIFAVHPLRVEAVAWASSFPYVLSLAAVLLALLAYLAYATAGSPSRRRWGLGLSICSYTASLLARANAIGFPLLLAAVDVYPLRRHAAFVDARHRGGAAPRALGVGALLLEKLPFLLAAVALASVESRSRELPTLREVGAGWRLTSAAIAPFLYLWRTFWPVGLTPLDPLPIEPQLEWTPLALGCAGLAAVTIAIVRARRKWPAVALAWVTYVLLLAPVVGLTPTGQQATADRYTYLPGVVVSLLAGAGIASLVASRGVRREATLAALGLVIMLGAATWRQSGWWHDSITLWTRAADLDERNDIATYNLATALAGAGREDEAIARYEQTLRLVADHQAARFNLNLILAKRAEREGHRLADAGRFDEALDQYGRALALDSSRIASRAARGLVLVRRSRLAEAVDDLRVALESNVDDPAVPNALAYALMETGRSNQAAAVLRQAVTRHPEDVDLAHNLARLLATSDDPAVRDGRTALRLALEVRDRTRGRDPRVLDTLAAAYAETGQRDLARATAEEASALAARTGDPEMAREIAGHARRYSRPPDGRSR
ncbi:MAG: tetratricopeptide repeat protein [Acidobacteria bacterium]|nr:tetratricopeptide repeat protein [Acidobacteriota bacterium]